MPAWNGRIARAAVDCVVLDSVVATVASLLPASGWVVVVSLKLTAALNAKHSYGRGVDGS